MRRQPTSEKLRSDRVRILPAPTSVQLRLAHDDARGPDSAKRRGDLPRPRSISRRKTRLFAQNEEGRVPLPRKVNNKRPVRKRQDALLRRAAQNHRTKNARRITAKMIRRQKINSAMRYAMMKQQNVNSLFVYGVG